MNSFYEHIKEDFTSLLISMRQAEPETLTNEQKQQIQRWFMQSLQPQVQRLTADVKRAA